MAGLAGSDRSRPTADIPPAMSSAVKSRPCWPGPGAAKHRINHSLGQFDMRNKYVAALIASLGAVVLVSCTEVPAKSTAEPIRLPVNSEPKFHAMRYTALPSGMQMTVLWTTEDLRAK